MIRISRIALSLALAGSLFACSKPAETPKPDESAANAGLAPIDEDEQQVTDRLALIDACNIELLEPNSIEWDSKWDPAVTRDTAQHPSGVRSAHWANEEELADLQAAGAAVPLELSCGSDAGSEYSILVEMVAPTSSVTDIPLQPASYPIAAGGNAKPGEVSVGNLQFNGASFQARSGNLTLQRFDSEGAAGSFVIEGTESGGENRPIRIEGTFDMPCRIERSQNGCTSEAGERE